MLYVAIDFDIKKEIVLTLQTAINYYLFFCLSFKHISKDILLTQI